MSIDRLKKARLHNESVLRHLEEMFSRIRQQPISVLGLLEDGGEGKLYFSGTGSSEFSMELFRTTPQLIVAGGKFDGSSRVFTGCWSGFLNGMEVSMVHGWMLGAVPSIHSPDSERPGGDGVRDFFRQFDLPESDAGFKLLTGVAQHLKETRQELFALPVLDKNRQ